MTEPRRHPYCSRCGVCEGKIADTYGIPPLFLSG